MRGAINRGKEYFQDLAWDIKNRGRNIPENIARGTARLGRKLGDYALGLFYQTAETTSRTLDSITKYISFERRVRRRETWFPRNDPTEI